MRKLFGALLILVASVAAALWLRDHDGFVVVSVAGLSVQASLIVFAGAVLALWLVLSLVAGLLRRIWRTPRDVRRWVGYRRHGKAREELLKGLIAVAEGEYDSAERTLMHRVNAAEVPVLNHLLAAVSAQRRGSWEARDEYLSLADQSEPRARIAVGLLQAQLQSDAGQWEQALATLNWLRERIPDNRRVLALLAQALTALEDWPHVVELLPDLRRRKALRGPHLESLEVRALSAYLQQLAREEPDRLDAVWNKLTREQRGLTPLQCAFADALIAAARDEDAQHQLRGWLKRDWKPELVRVWGRLGKSVAESAFGQAEKWLREHPRDGDLLYAAGQLALRAELWGRARSYLEAAGARSARADVQRDLAQLYEQIGETEKARQAYRRALGLDAGRPNLPRIEAVAEG